MSIHEEYQYLNLLKELINSGNIKNDRTGTGTLSLFGKQMKFSLRKSFPILTTKKVFWRGIVEELLWFIRGSTNSLELSNKKINIWNENSSRKYLDSIGLTDRQEGDLGPIYGFQWRHYGAEYKDMFTDYSNKGIDQLKYVIDKIKNNPDDRRMLIVSWNPVDIPKMALPPCHCLVQFYVANNELSCQLYQRSADMGLGVPFNIASYALLTCIIAKITDLKPGDFIHCIGDCHLYRNHVDNIKLQLERKPREFPVLKIKTDKKNIEDFTYEDFILENYNPYDSINLKFSV